MTWDNDKFSGIRESIGLGDRGWGNGGGRGARFWFRVLVVLALVVGLVAVWLSRY